MTRMINEDNCMCRKKSLQTNAAKNAFEVWIWQDCWPFTRKRITSKKTILLIKRLFLSYRNSFCMVSCSLEMILLQNVYAGCLQKKKWTRSIYVMCNIDILCSILVDLLFRIRHAQNLWAMMLATVAYEVCEYWGKNSRSYRTWDTQKVGRRKRSIRNQNQFKVIPCTNKDQSQHIHTLIRILNAAVIYNIYTTSSSSSSSSTSSSPLVVIVIISSQFRLRLPIYDYFFFVTLSSSSRPTSFPSHCTFRCFGAVLPNASGQMLYLLQQQQQKKCMTRNIQHNKQIERIGKGKVERIRRRRLQQHQQQQQQSIESEL